MANVHAGIQIPARLARSLPKGRSSELLADAQTAYIAVARQLMSVILMRSTLNIDLLAPSRFSNSHCCEPIEHKSCQHRLLQRPSRQSRAKCRTQQLRKKKRNAPNATPPMWSTPTSKESHDAVVCRASNVTESRELSNFRRGPLDGAGRHIREEQAQPLSHCRVRESGISKRRI